MGVFGFRIKLMLSMLAVVGVVTAVTLTVAMDRVERANDRQFRARVEQQLTYLPREQEARLGAVRQKAGEFASLPPVQRALEGRETTRLYLLAQNRFQKMLAEEFRKLASELEAEEYAQARLAMHEGVRELVDRLANSLEEPEVMPAMPVAPQARRINPSSPMLTRLYHEAVADGKQALADQLRKLSGSMGRPIPRRVAAAEPPAAKAMRMADPDGTEQAKKITASFLVFVGEQGELLVPQGRFGQFFDNPARRKFRARLKEFVPSLVELDEQGVGYLALDEGIIELVCTPVEQAGGGRKVGTLVLGFPLSSRAEMALNDIGDLMTGMWVDGRLHSRAIAPAAVEPVTGWLEANADGEQPEDRVDLVSINGDPFRIFYAPLAGAAGLPQAYKVGMYSWAEPLAAQADIRSQVLMLGGLMGLAAMIMSWLISLGLFKPVRRLYKATQRLREGDYDVRVPVRSNDELGSLAQAFNQTAQELALKDKYRDVLNKVADKAVADRLMSDEVNLGGETHGMTVLFCDIRKYTELTQNLEPEETVALLNEHMTAMTWVIHEHGGLVDKFVGDMIMAVFGATGSDPTAPERAVACARHMLQERKVLNMLRGQEINVGIGIATGQMVAGFIGSEDRLNFTVIGQGANLASRLCTVAKPMDILVDEITCEAAKEGRTAEPLPPMEIKGFRDLQAVYRLSDEEAPRSEAVDKPVSA